MAISLTIYGTPIIFLKAFAPEDRDSILNFVRQAAAEDPQHSGCVLFIDTPATPSLLEAVETLTAEGYVVTFRDHHRIEGILLNERGQQIAAATAKLVTLLGRRATVSTRRQHPACSLLVDVGEFAGALCVIADPDADGLTGACKALGISYPELDRDAEILDGPRSRQVGLSPLADLFMKGHATLPPYNAANPAVYEKAKSDLFSLFVAAIQGGEAAKVELEKRVTVYEASVVLAKKLATASVEVVAGVWLTDVVGKPGTFDQGTLSAVLGSRPGCVITVTRKSNGPIAAKHGGIQISLAVVKAAQESINLQSFLPAGFTSSPEAGIISNTTFLLHVSEKVWNETVLPALQQRFGAAS